MSSYLFIAISFYLNIVCKNNVCELGLTNPTPNYLNHALSSCNLFDEWFDRKVDHVHIWQGITIKVRMPCGHGSSANGEAILTQKDIMVVLNNGQ